MTLIAVQRPASSGRKIAYHAKSVPSTILTKMSPEIAKTVAMTQSASGFFLKRIAWMRPAKIGVEPIEITVPIATPINKTPLKKRI